MASSLKDYIRKIIPVRTSVFNAYVDEQRRANKQLQATLASSFNTLRQEIESVGNISREANWANTFHDTIVNSSWLENVSLSPGRWAVGYQYLYVLYRALDEFKPHHILEFGLGESTTMINAFIKTHRDATHTVIEHDPEWIKFYSSSKNDVIDTCDILQCDLELTRLSGVSHEIRVYEDCIQKLKNRYPRRTYDFISIDGPFGYDMPEVARIDSLELIPDMLSDSFAIMLDDFNRSGEKRLAEMLKERLDSACIEYKTGEYRGEKTTYIIASKDLGFLCSL